MIRAVECGWLVRTSASSTMYVVDEMRKKKEKKKKKKKKKNNNNNNNNNNMECWFAGHEIQVQVQVQVYITNRFGVTLCHIYSVPTDRGPAKRLVSCDFSPMSVVCWI